MIRELRPHCQQFELQTLRGCNFATPYQSCGGKRPLLSSEVVHNKTKSSVSCGYSIVRYTPFDGQPESVLCWD